MSNNLLPVEDLRDTTPQSLSKLNRMIRGIVQKLSGNIDYLDLSSDVKQQLYTYPLQIGGEDNLDSNYPLYIRFYVPSDVKKFKSASINAIVSNYRMDSKVANSSDQTIYVSGNASASSAGKSDVLTSQPSVKTTTDASNKESAKVDTWGDTLTGYYQVPPADPLSTSLDYITNAPNAQYPNWHYSRADSGQLPIFIWKYNNGVVEQAALAALIYDDGNIGQFAAVDMYLLQHSHDISHTHGMNHTHTINFDWTHTHTINLSGTVSAHTHPLNEGIYVSSTNPTGVRIYINDVQVGEVLRGNNATQNNIDISQNINVGWNVLKITAETVARITVYGIIELVTKIN